MSEIDLMRLYPKSKRSIDARAMSTEAERAIACQFGKEYFDGDRRTGYGGYNYHPRFWHDTVRLFRDHYQLPDDGSVLDVGCAKGFMLYDLKELMPEVEVAGIDISKYGIENAIEPMKPYLWLGNARDLPYEDGSFDLVTAINTIHNLPLEECKQALREVERVSRSNAFIMVDAYRTDQERDNLEKWVLTCKTYMHVEEWKELFAEVGYNGDYYWFIAE